MARWAELQDKVREDAVLSEARQTQLYPYLDEVNTTILARAEGSPEIPTEWPSIDAMRGQPRGYIVQRILRHKVDTSTAWLPQVEQIQSALLRPLDYSRIR
jgi:hypothetical protein